MPIDIVLVPPSQDRPATFPEDGELFGASLNPWAEQANALEANVNAKEASVVQDAAIVEQSRLSVSQTAVTAASLLAAAMSIVNASKWRSGSYIAGDCVWDNVTPAVTYRCILAVSSSVHPSQDLTHWVELSNLPAQGGFAGSVLLTDGTNPFWGLLPDRSLVVIKISQMWVATSKTAKVTCVGGGSGAWRNGDYGLLGTSGGWTAFSGPGITAISAPGAYPAAQTQDGLSFAPSGGDLSGYGCNPVRSEPNGSSMCPPASMFGELGLYGGHFPQSAYSDHWQNPGYFVFPGRVNKVRGAGYPA